MIVSCDRCGKMFKQKPSIIKRNKNNFCSKQCCDLFKITKISVKCKNCGKDFLKNKSFFLKTENHFCSTKCSGMYFRKRNLVKCKTCGIEVLKTIGKISDNNFCSKQCFYNRKTTKVSLVCEICGKIYKRYNYRKNQSRFCSKECQNKSCGKNHNLYQDKGSKWRYRFLFDPFPENCSFCNKHSSEVSRLEVHHIDKNRDNNVISNLIVLCTSCHKKIDGKTMMIKICISCGKSFYPRPSLFNKRKYCCIKCYKDRLNVLDISL